MRKITIDCLGLKKYMLHMSIKYTQKLARDSLILKMSMCADPKAKIEK